MKDLQVLMRATHKLFRVVPGLLQLFSAGHRVCNINRKGWKALLKQKSRVSDAVSVVRNSLSILAIVLFLAWESLSKCHFLIGFVFIIRASCTVAEAENPWIKLCLV